MRSLQLPYSLLGAAAVATLLAACSGTTQAGSGTNPAVANAAASHGSLNTLLIRGPGVLVHPDRSLSHMLPNAKAKDLLYISDSGTNDVNVYTYPKISPAGTLTGFNEPQGECVDKKGDVFVTNTGDSDILEFAHGGTSPVATLNDAGQYPVGCSLDPKSGDLAVSNIISTSGGAGSVSIYKGATGTPTTYLDPAFSRVYFLGYDPHHTLWLDGEDVNGAFLFAEFKKGKFNHITLNTIVINFPGGVQYCCPHVSPCPPGCVNVGDQNGTQSARVYQTNGPNVDGTTDLNGSVDVVQYFIDKKILIAPDAGNASVELYNFPAGGDPINQITGLSEPIGSAVSK